MKERLLDFFKWWLIIAFSAVAFYVVCPKYHYWENPKTMRANKITGKIERLKNRKWENISEYRITSRRK